MCIQMLDTVYTRVSKVGMPYTYFSFQRLFLTKLLPEERFSLPPHSSYFIEISRLLGRPLKALQTGSREPTRNFRKWSLLLYWLIEVARFTPTNMLYIVSDVTKMMIGYLFSRHYIIVQCHRNVFQFYVICSSIKRDSLTI